MVDRLTEIRARVAEEEANRANHYPRHWWAGDLEYALGEIERLHDISAFNGLTEQVKALSVERDRLLGEIERLTVALLKIAGEREDIEYQRAPSLAHAQRIARAALEDSHDAG